MVHTANNAGNRWYKNATNLFQSIPSHCLQLKLLCSHALWRRSLFYNWIIQEIKRQPGHLVTLQYFSCVVSPSSQLLQHTQHRMLRWQTNNEVQMICKEAAMSYDPGLYMEGQRKTTKYLTRADVPAEIWTEHFPNMRSKASWLQQPIRVLDYMAHQSLPTALLYAQFDAMSHPVNHSLNERLWGRENKRGSTN